MNVKRREDGDDKETGSTVGQSFYTLGSRDRAYIERANDEH